MRLGLSASSGVLSLLQSAAADQRDEVKFLFDGDLCQMSAQEQFLKRQGLNIGRCNVYPGVYSEEDFKRALRLIWEQKVEGWWHYRTTYIRYEICTGEAFDQALSRA